MKSLYLEQGEPQYFMTESKSQYKFMRTHLNTVKALVITQHLKYK
jgi:hypothetical protein